MQNHLFWCLLLSRLGRVQWSGLYLCFISDHWIIQHILWDSALLVHDVF